MGNSSEGCQVLKGNYEKAEVKRYFWLMSQDPDGVVKYTLRDSAELGGDSANFASLKPGYDETAARTPKMKAKDDPAWKSVSTAYATHFNDSGPKGNS